MITPVLLPNSSLKAGWGQSVEQVLVFLGKANRPEEGLNTSLAFSEMS